MQGRACRLLGAAGDEVGNRLGLREVELVVEKRSLGEFAGLCKPRAKLDGGVNEHRHDDRPAMALQLQNRLACERAGRRKVKRDAAVQLLAAGVTKCAVGRMAGFR